MKYFQKELLCMLSLILLFTSCRSEQDKLLGLVEQSVRDTEISGYLYVEKESSVLYKGLVQTPALPIKTISDTTKVYLASLSKLFSEIAILKLSDQGKIDLNSPISDYRDSFQPTFGQRIRVIDLLHMSSGLPREINNDSLPKVQFDDYKLAGAFLDTIPDFELSFEPGTKQAYSNLNYWILGAIIEEVTNHNLHEALDILIFDELHMENSGLFTTKEPIQNGFFFKEGKWEMDKTAYEFRYASGGCYSSVNDLILLSKALSGNSFLTPDSKILLLDSKNKIEVYGSLPGNSNMFIQDFEEDYVIISLNNLGLRDLSFMTTLKSGIENQLGIASEERPRRVVKLEPIESLNDSIAIEKSLKAWARTVVSGDADEIYKIIQSASIEGSMSKEDRTWQDLSNLNSTLPNFRALGYRWVNDQKPEGIEVWFGSDKEGKLAIRWLLSKDNPSLVENLFIMPDDMTWQDKSY